MFPNVTHHMVTVFPGLSIITSQPALTHTESALSRYTGMADETVLLSRLTKRKCGLGECVRGHTLNMSYKWHPHY